jgi:hypothetical protein
VKVLNRLKNPMKTAIPRAGLRATRPTGKSFEILGCKALPIFTEPPN